jgi:hypothetical protein
VKIVSPDRSPVLRYNHEKSKEEKSRLLEHYVCDLKQKQRTKEVTQWMREHPKLANLDKKVLSLKTWFWLDEFLSGHYQMGKLDLITAIDPEIKAELQQFRLKKPVKAYRGIHFGLNKLSFINKLCIDKLDPKYYYQYKDDRESSWTWNYTMADNFAKIGSFNFILQHTFSPDDILIDLRLLHEYCRMRGVKTRDEIGGLQDEIIIMPGDYSCEVKDASINKNDLLCKENMDALQKLGAFVTPLDHFPRDFMYGGYDGGLYGMMTLPQCVRDKKQEIKVMWSFDKTKDGYALSYCMLPASAEKEERDKTKLEIKIDKNKDVSSFFKFINKTVKYLKHEGKRYYDAICTQYNTHHKKCEDKCDSEYRRFLYKVTSPYVIKSHSFEKLVDMFLSDLQRVFKAC